MGELDLDRACSARSSEDPDDTLTLLVRCRRPPTSELRAAVRRLAPRLILDQTRAGTAAAPGGGRPRAVPAHRGGELDLDRSMDAVVAARGESRHPALDELTARDWGRPELALCLVVDRSGSMNGHPADDRGGDRRRPA